MYSILQRHIYSSAGESGLLSLQHQLEEKWFAKIVDAWREREEADGIARLCDLLIRTITDVDRRDLSAAQIKLRPTTDGLIPLGVICKLTRSLIEYLAEGDKQSERYALEGLVVSAHARPNLDFEQGFRAALAELLAEEGDDLRAIAEIEANLSVRSSSPYSQQLLYRALQKQKRSGQIDASPVVDLADLSQRFCDQPFTTLLTLGGRNSIPNAHACGCAAFLPYALNGSHAADDKAEESGGIWNGAEAQEIRRSILDGDFSYCSPLMCPYLVKGTLPKKDEIQDPALRDVIDNRKTVIERAPRRISLGHDDSCNIACPSCRDDIIVAKNNAREAMDRFVDRHILPLMQGAHVELYLSGDGDPIGSKHYRRLLHSLDPVKHADVHVYLQSNGLLVTPKEWDSLSHIHPLIKGMIISIDAAEAETYEDVRRPGKWETLTSNMDFIAELRRTGAIWFLCINFVVQKKNFRQMPAFVGLGQRWSVDRVLFSKMYYTPRAGETASVEFKSNAIADDDHPDHHLLLDVLKHTVMRSKIVDLFNLTGGQVPEPETGPPAHIDERSVVEAIQSPLFDG